MSPLMMLPMIMIFLLFKEFSYILCRICALTKLTGINNIIIYTQLCLLTASPGRGMARTLGKRDTPIFATEYML